jgi:hypothetical protein
MWKSGINIYLINLIGGKKISTQKPIYYDNNNKQFQVQESLNLVSSIQVDGQSF